VARKRKSQKSKRPKGGIVFFNVRMPEWLRRDLERVSAAHGRSMNTEIVGRLTQSFSEKNNNKIVASALVQHLDDEIINEIVNIARRIDQEDAAADEAAAWRDEERSEREAEDAGDAYAEHMRDVEREGGPEGDK
jgi:Arc-like DNA binding domain